MEHCAKSNIFKPLNPWLMVVLHLMVELYQVAELKLNLKFEIEVLFKGLNVELKDVPPTPTTILHNQPSAKLLQQQQQQQHHQQQSLGQLQHLNQQQQHQATVQMQLQQQHQHQQWLSHQPATGIAQGLEHLSIAGRYGAAANGRIAPQLPLTALSTTSLCLFFVSAAGIVGAGAMGAAALQQAGAGANIPAGVPPIAAGGTPSAQQSLEKFLQGMAKFEHLLEAADQDAGLSELPQDHKIQHALCLIPMVAAQSSSRDETALALSQEVVQLLFKIDSKLGRKVLDRLCEISLKAAREVSAWLIYAEDERKFNVPVEATSQD
ncbi:hypothetical protein NDA13_006452 [Ustilago tritici]|nr:hypothetical protein NDA13_006452 [Ustilago tritici]